MYADNEKFLIANYNLKNELKETHMHTLGLFLPHLGS